MKIKNEQNKHHKFDQSNGWFLFDFKNMRIDLSIAVLYVLYY